MSDHHAHDHDHGPAPARTALGCAVLTISDTRTLDTDKSGALAADRLAALGHRVLERRIVTDDLLRIRALAAELCARGDVDVIVTTGGTGLTFRDVTPDAIAPLATKAIPGFGELFRWLSYADIGSSTVQSRADGFLCGKSLVFVLPGSTGAVRLAFDKILDQQLDPTFKPCNFIELLPRIRGDRP